MKNQRLTKRNKDELWGEDGPYSEVSLSEQTRILDDSISRVFLVVEAKINPFTFEFVLKHREAFRNDEAVQQLLDHAEFRGIDGYVVSAGEEEFIDRRSFEIASSYRSIAIENILKMHDFVIKAFGLRGHTSNGIKIVESPSDKKYVWDTVIGSIIPAADSIWEPNVYVDSPAGVKNGKIRYFVTLVLARSRKTLTREEVKYSAMATKKIADKFGVDIENAEANMGYVMLTMLIAPDNAPADIIDQCIAASNIKKKLFLEQYYITNASRPTGKEIEDFVRSLLKDNRKEKH